MPSRPAKNAASEFEQRAADLIAAAPTPEVRKTYQHDLRALRRRGIDTFDALVEALPRTKGSVAETALRLVVRFGRAKAVPILLPLLEWGSAWALAELGGARACAGCIAVLRSGGAVPLRVAAAYALTFMHDDRAASALIDHLRDSAEDSGVRGQCAEGLAELFECNKKHRLYRKAAKAALDGLADPSPTVRFWSAFALGKMCHRAAIPALRGLAGDRADCPSMWRVCDEASDAIAWIEGRATPLRSPMRTEP